MSNNWREVSLGIEYIDLSPNVLTPWSHTHAFRIDLNKNTLDLVMAEDLSKAHASVDEFAQHSTALIALNGGFFDHKHQPLGLRVGHHQQQNPIKHISWWGIFYIKNNKPHISSVHAYTIDKATEFALQSGPRLLIKGRIPHLKPGLAERSALGINADNKVIIVVTDNNPITTTELATILKSPPLLCTDALNLDGGNSSQLKTTMASLQINAHGLSNVSDAIIVKPRKDL